MKKGLKGFVVRSSLFLTIAFVIVPLLMNALAINKPASAGIPILLPFFVCAGILTIFGLLRNEFHENKANPIEIFICGALTIVYYFLLSIITYNAVFITLSYPQMYYLVQYLLYALALIFLFFTLFSIKFTMRSSKILIISASIVVPFTVVAINLILSWRFFLEKTISWLMQLFTTFNIPATLVTNQGNDVLLSIGKISAQFTLYDVGVFQLIAFGALAILLIIADRKFNEKTLLIAILGLIGAWLVNFLQIFAFLGLTNDNPSLATLLLHPNTGWMVFALYFLLWYEFAYQSRQKPAKNKKSRR